MRAARIAVALVALAAFATLAPPGAARADDEGSEHTAQLVGDPADTLGVTLRFEAARGWSMDYRARSGAAVQRVALPFLPADHAHYSVVVGPGRATLTFLLASREDVTAATDFAWIVGGDGKVQARWVVGDFLSAAEVAKLERSVSHTFVLSAIPVLATGEIWLTLNGKAAALDPVARQRTR